LLRQEKRSRLDRLLHQRRQRDSHKAAREEQRIDHEDELAALRSPGRLGRAREVERQMLASPSVYRKTA
jgi:hypothetical protein